MAGKGNLISLSLCCVVFLYAEILASEQLLPVCPPGSLPCYALPWLPTVRCIFLVSVSREENVVWRQGLYLDNNIIQNPYTTRLPLSDESSTKSVSDLQMNTSSYNSFNCRRQIWEPAHTTHFLSPSRCRDLRYLWSTISELNQIKEDEDDTGMKNDEKDKKQDAEKEKNNRQNYNHVMQTTELIEREKNEED